VTDPDNPMISIRNVDKHFGTFQAIHDVSLDIQRGQFFSLLGASGCGKTTLLRMLAGFESASAGSIMIDGKSMAEVPPHHRPVNMVFQSYAIFPHLSVRDNIAYGLRKQKLARTKRYDMVDEMLDLIKLPGYATRRANELSGGQRQRVALARALILRPKALLLDEPLGALDKQLREQMQLELRALQKSVGVTFVLVTHDQEEALTLSDKIAVMSAGRVLQIDTPTGLYESPKSREVASFIGNMNFFNGRIGKTSGPMAEIEIEGLGRTQIDAGTLRHAEGGPVLVAMRPEKLTLGLQRPEHPRNMVAGTVHTTSYLGERRQFYISIDGKADPVAVSTQNQRRLGNEEITAGCKVWLSWNDDAFVILDHE
jgi:spermidine/putrescine ABC transporter ATP-binding subunit